jgi:predicted ribosome quality control (RQC) complex YloA/Tae2 family protein
MCMRIIFASTSSSRPARPSYLRVQTYIFKLARTGVDAAKCVLLLESGLRVHTTEYVRDKNVAPSSVSMKLRKHLNGKRITAVSQLGVDRIVDLTFGSGQAEHHVLLELFAQGNVILTDSAYRVLTLLRVYKDNENATAVSPGLLYPVQNIRLYHTLTMQQLQEALLAASDKVALKRMSHVLDRTCKSCLLWQRIQLLRSLSLLLGRLIVGSLRTAGL